MCQQKLTEVGKEKDKHMAADKEKDTMLEDTRRELEDMKTQSTQNTETMASLQKNLVCLSSDLKHVLILCLHSSGFSSVT